LRFDNAENVVKQSLTCARMHEPVPGEVLKTLSEILFVAADGIEIKRV
jgi:hypothetical protein